MAYLRQRCLVARIVLCFTLLFLLQINETVAFHHSSSQPHHALSLPIITSIFHHASPPQLQQRKGQQQRVSSSSSSSSLNMIPLLVEETSSLSSSMMTVAAAATTTTGISINDLFNNNDFKIFLAGIFPFMWATIEFWRRIMFGESFGTGTDSIVIIGSNDSPQDSRGSRILGKGALTVAYTIFVIAFGTLGVVGYSVLSSTPPSQEDLNNAIAASTAAASVVISP
jgi:hypothetical protein